MLSTCLIRTTRRSAGKLFPLPVTVALFVIATFVVIPVDSSSSPSSDIFIKSLSDISSSPFSPSSSSSSYQPPQPTPSTETTAAADIVDQFLSIVERYGSGSGSGGQGDRCLPGTTYNLGDGVVAQYGLRRFRRQAMTAVDRANFLTRLWKNANADAPGSSESSPLDSERFLYAAVLSMVESDDELFGAGNCYDRGEYKNYGLFCPYAHRVLKPDDSERAPAAGTIVVKDLSVEYHYMDKDSEFFYQARLKAERKLAGVYNTTIGKRFY